MLLSQILAILLQIHSDRGSNSEQQISICQNIFFFNSRIWVFKCVCVCVYLRIMVSLFLILMNALCISSKQFYQHFFWCIYLCQLINFSSMCECEKNHIICECKRKIPLNSIEICQQYHLNMTMHLKLASFFISGFGFVKQYRCSWFFETVIK